MKAKPALLVFSLAFTVTLAALVVAAELQLGPVASMMDWFYNVTVKLGGFKHVDVMDWVYSVVGGERAKAVVGSGWGLAYSVSIDVNSTQASPDASMQLGCGSSSNTVALAPGLSFQLSPGAGSPSGGGQICASPRECGLSLSWGQIYYTDALGNPASPAAGRQILIHVPIYASPRGRYGKALVIVEIHRYNPEYGTVIIDYNMAINVAYMLVGDDVEATVLWWPRDPGTYLLRAYIWNDFPGKAQTWESYIEPLEKVITIS